VVAKLYTKQNLPELISLANAPLYYVEVIEKGISFFIKNIDCEVGLIHINSRFIPFTFNVKSTRNTAYIASCISQFLHYSYHEIISGEKFGRGVKIAARCLYLPSVFICNFLQMDKTVHVNNQLLSTNLQLQLSIEEIAAVLNILKANFPSKTILWRGVNEESDSELLGNLHKLGFKSIISRQLYMLNPQSGVHLKKRPYSQDVKRYNQTTTLNWKTLQVEDLNTAMLQKICEFYRALYLEKYSHLNPLYTTSFIESTLRNKQLQYDIVFLEEELVGVQAYSIKEGIITTPFIGYNQQKPKELGLYKALHIRLTQTAEQKLYLLNMSSGAADFKKQRGGHAVFEYHLLYTKHTNSLQKLCWKCVHFASEKFIRAAMLTYGI
jgi:hypothetical protein